MFRIMNDYIRDMHLQVTDHFYNQVRDFLDMEENVASYCITVNFNRYIVDIKLAQFSVENAGEVYRRLVGKITCPYSELSVRYNEGKAVRYRYATCNENKNGYYCDIVFEPEL